MNTICSQNISTETLSAWYSNLLPLAQQNQIASHIDECSACQNTLASYERIAHVLRTQPRLPAQEEVWQGVYSSITNITNITKKSRGHMKKPQRIIAIAATSGLVALFALVFLFFHSLVGTPPGVSKTPTAFTATTMVNTPTPTIAATATSQPITLNEFSSPSGFYPDRLTTGPDGNLWVTDSGQMQIMRITPSGNETLYKIPSAQSHCCISMGGDDIVVGPDGNLWFTEGNDNKIGRLTINGDFTEYSLPEHNSGSKSFSSGPKSITVGSDGNLWFTEETGNIGKMTLSGFVTEFAVPSLAPKGSTMPNAITTGPDGNLWFTESSGDHIGRITPQGDITQFELSQYTQSYGIVSGPDGNLWFTANDYKSSEIGRITPQGAITTYPNSGTFANEENIILGSDGKLWFTSGTVIGNITVQGVVATYSSLEFSRTYYPIDITDGPDGKFWITEYIGDASASGGKVAQFTP